MLNDLPGRERIFQLIWCLWALIKAVILPFQANSSPHKLQQQTENLLQEYELDDETLQKANISEFSYKPCPSCSKCSSSASRHKSKSLSFARLAHTPWNSPIFVIKKKSNKWHHLTDLRKVSERRSYFK